MFDSKHYIPILKWKPAEQRALEELSTEEKKLITPLIQIVMPNPKMPKDGESEKTRDEQLEEVIEGFKVKAPRIPEEIQKSWGKSPTFVDLSLVYTSSLKIEGLNQILTIGESLGLFLIPVVNLSSDIEFKNTAVTFAKKYKHGLCLRLVRADFVNMEALFQTIKEFLATYSLSENDIDLLIDLKEGNDEYVSFVELSQQLPNLLKWRTFTFASGAFPVDLTECELGENYRSRTDWNNWIQLYSKTMQRSPSFGDYAILHPIYKESARFFSPSASIRYTSNDKWLIMRGQKGKTDQYLANAQLLSQDQKFKDLFCGATFSFGDAYIVEKGKDLKSKKTGNATNWLTAGINHHLAYVVSQLSNLS